MVNIHHHNQTKPAEDQQALIAFQQQWQTYQKLVDGNYLSHRQVYDLLHQVLVDHFNGEPFSFFELACGDASSTVAALKGTTVSHYHGLDLAQPALEMASRNLEDLSCPVVLEEMDFIEAMRNRPEPADVVWIGLSLHHLKTEGKRELMREVRNIIGEQGVFSIYEPFFLPGESMQSYMIRVESENRSLWETLTSVESDAIFNHIKGNDFPETVQDWQNMALEQGFNRAEVMFVNPTNYLAMFCFYA